MIAEITDWVVAGFKLLKFESKAANRIQPASLNQYVCKKIYFNLKYKHLNLTSTLCIV